MSKFKVMLFGKEIEIERDTDGCFVIPNEIRQLEKFGTALKPAHEPIVLARKPLEAKTIAANVLQYGTGALNIDGCRVGTADDMNPRDFDDSRRTSPKFSGKFNNGKIGEYRSGVGEVPNGRWPANIILSDDQEVLEAFPSTAPSRKGKPRGSAQPGDGWGMTQTGAEYSDRGSAARFFYVAKASKKDRGEGNAHNTVKPTDLMKYLCRLITPPNGIVFDPFMGSGSTGKAAILEGFQFIGIEKEPEYYLIALERIEKVQNEKGNQLP
jgi:DNA modification methylase